MDQTLVLALDIGTSSIRAALYDSRAEPLTKYSARIERSLTLTSDGGAEIDADEAVDQIVAVVDAVLDRSKKLKGEIRCVATSAFWHSLVGIDARGRPTTKVLCWADTRSRKYSAVLKRRFDGSELHDRTGAPFHSSYWPAKLMWLRAECPSAFQRTDRWLSFSDYLSLKLLGVPATSVSMASATGAFDIRRCEWDPELTKFLHLKPAMLPWIAADGETLTVKQKYRTRWPRLAAAEWFPSIGDGAADNIGSGCTDKSKIALMVGTSGAARVAYKGEPPAAIPSGLWSYRIDRKHSVIGGALSDGGGMYRWLKKNLNLPSDAEADMPHRGAAGHGLAVLPFLAGERSTGYNEGTSAAILGLTSSHDSVDILQAALESVAFRFADIIDQIKRVNRRAEIVATGGALLNSPVWVQIIADVLGRDLTVLGVSESSSRGAVLLALKSIGKIESIESLQIPATAVNVAFHPKCHAIYKVARKKHHEYYQSIINTNS